jgi:hypothetical protein
MARESSEFHVRLDGIKLPADAEKRIAAEVRGTVLRELARLDLRTPGLSIKFPKEWLGIWIDKVGLPQDPVPLRPSFR